MRFRDFLPPDPPPEAETPLEAPPFADMDGMRKEKVRKEIIDNFSLESILSWIIFLPLLILLIVIFGSILNHTSFH